MSCTIGWQDPLLAYHLSTDEALDIASSLTEDDEDRWLYFARCTAQEGIRIIEVCDADGMRLGYL